jgi:hypothetical protein
MLQIKKSLLALSLLASCLSNAMIIEKESLSMPIAIQNVAVIHENNSFIIEDDNGAHTLQPYQMSPELRNIPTDKLAKMLTAGSYLKVNKTLDETYKVDLQQRLQGGGPILSTWGMHIGVAGTNIVGHGVLMFISSFAGPVAGPAVYQGLAVTYGPAIAATSKAVGLGLAISGAVAPTI